MNGSDLLRPPVLRAGDLVRLVSPSGPARPDRVERGVELLTGWGLRVEVAKHAFDRHGFLAGTDAERLADLNDALGDPAVRGVLCTRGGYGAQRIVDGLELAAVRRDPKVVAGFSDTTALQLALWRGARLATLYGPGAAWQDGRTPAQCAESLRAAIMSTAPVVVSRDPAEPTAAVAVPGTASGTLIGGNLCLLDASLGTPDFPALDGAILLLEDVGEPPYKVDRMLTHLRRAGVLAGIAGVALGQFVNCTGHPSVSIVEVLAERLGELGVPMLGGLPIGHGDGQLTVPLGVPAIIDVAAGTLTAAPAVA